MTDIQKVDAAYTTIPILPTRLSGKLKSGERIRIRKIKVPGDPLPEQIRRPNICYCARTLTSLATVRRGCKVFAMLGNGSQSLHAFARGGMDLHGPASV